MHRITKRTYRIAVAAFLTVSTGGMVAWTPARLDPRASCVETSKWVADHRGNLPSTVAELSKLPTAYRRAVFNELTPAARRALWREHIGGFLRGQPQLTPAQRQLASEVMQLFDSLAAAKPGDGILEDMVTRVNAVYPKDLAGRVFMQLGESDETDSPAGVSGGVQQASVLNWLATPLTVVRSLGSKAHTGSVACSCNTGVNSCGMVCGGSGLCDIQEIGCGFLWFYGCNGTCGPWRGREDAIQ